VVYLRRNIERKTVYEGMDAVKVWEYEEAQLTPGEYIEYRAALAELESPAMQQLKTDNEALSLALADIYERVEEQEEKQENIMAALADIYESVAVESEV
jgi:CII-binding regulator of phage lambda lysogenization HflD